MARTTKKTAKATTSVNKVSKSLSKLQLQGVDTDKMLEEIGMYELVEWLSDSNPKLAKKLEKYIIETHYSLPSNAREPADEGLLPEARQRMAEVQYKMVVEGDSTAEEMLIHYNDMYGPIQGLIDEMLTQFTVEELVEILEAGTDVLVTHPIYLRLQASPLLSDEWGVEDETYMPDEEDEADGYMDDELHSEEEMWVGDEQEYMNTLEVSTLPENWREDPMNKPEVPGSSYMLVEMSDKLDLPYPTKSEVRWYLDNSYTQSEKCDAVQQLERMSERLPSFQAVLEGPIGGDREVDAVRILHAFLTVLVEKLQSL